VDGVEVRALAHPAQKKKEKEMNNIRNKRFPGSASARITARKSIQRREVICEIEENRRLHKMS
jgi:hypothetical protein